MIDGSTCRKDKTMTGQKRSIIVEQSSEQADELAAALIRTIICDAVGQRGMCSIALAGGTTPRPLYQQLAKEAAAEAVPWNSVEVFFGDERDVPHDHIDSNYLMIQRTLLDHLPIEPIQVHPMPADVEDLDQAAAKYEQDIRDTLPEGPGGVPQFDCILLGMGGDGHTASLFPNTPGLMEKRRLVMAQFVPILGRHRMTFTFPLINAAANVILLVTGEDKAMAAAAMLGDDRTLRDKIPSAKVNPKHGKLWIVLDSAAGRIVQHSKA